MEFVALTKRSFRSFLNKHPLKTFLQTPEIGELREKSGWTVDYLGVKDDKKIVAATMLVSKNYHFGKREFYAPRGLLVDYHDFELLEFFTKELKNYCKEQKGYILRIDPYLIKRERDINGDIVENGINNTRVVDNLRKLGYKKSKTLEQVGWTFVLDLNKTEEELLSSMRNFTKRNIQKGLKNHIKIREATYEELPIVRDLLDATCTRKNFHNRSLTYFQNMYKLFMPRGEIKFLIADINLKELLSELKKEAKIQRKRFEESVKANLKKEKLKKIEEQINSIGKRLKEVEKAYEQYGDVVSASSAVFLTYGDEVLYLFGGNRKELMHFCAPYMIQWHMICYGIKNNFKRYNFYGISGIFDKTDKDYGIYEFKRGFTGYVEELIGEYELPLDCFYYVFKILNKIKR